MWRGNCGRYTVAEQFDFYFVSLLSQVSCDTATSKSVADDDLRLILHGGTPWPSGVRAEIAIIVAIWELALGQAARHAPFTRC